MLIDIYIEVNGDEITIDIPHDKLNRVLRNIAICSVDKEALILSVGKSFDEIPPEELASWKEQYLNLEARPLYSQQQFRVGGPYTIAIYAIQQIRRSYSESIFSQLSRDFSDRFHIHFTLPAYEQVDGALQRELESSLLFFPNLKHLTINNHKVVLEKQQRRALDWEYFKAIYPITISLIVGPTSPFLFGALGIRVVETIAPTLFYVNHSKVVRLLGLGSGVVAFYLLAPLFWILILRPVLSLNEIEEYFSSEPSTFGRRASAIVQWWMR